ncbi:dihydrolipoyl dehydrogenase family protein [Rhodococcus tukisamuensis]|uniref:Dihydrolipoamide dehydrogenase n=1 Tax=Rhodococcus tukisamuensis TaxID=168276 RepID=A0A1G6PGB1_9NOCA|nr:NAD(P)/FAD-dependent oxidoreductase [Rhodococcus tukisamuensis]SDC78487.1 dihydrolipoamide dehydrogenase [Rhodococcus tukisamuensis]
MTTTTDEYDVIVIGGGPAGENAAAYAIAGSSRTAAIVEHELVGGECSYWACMPSKALLRPAEVLGSARAMPGVRGLVGIGRLDVPAVLRRRDAVTNNHDDSGQVSWAESAGIDVIRGAGSLTGERTVLVSRPDRPTRTLRARSAVVLATGTTAAVPPVPGLAEALPWTSRDATNLREVPARVAIIGGGVVATECANWMLALGVRELTLLVRGDTLLASAEPFAGELVTRSLREAGASVRFGARLQSVEREDPEDTGIGRIHGGPVTLVANGEPLVVDEVIVAAGRVPATASLGLSEAGVVATGAGHVTTDEHLTVEGAAGAWLYAVGDVNGRAPLTHMGKYQARVCGDVIAARADGRSLDGPRFTAHADHDQVPQVVFTDPEVASVGRTERRARADGLDVETVEVPIAVAGSSLARDDFTGRAKLVIDRATDTLVGATFAGTEVAELVHAATVAVVGAVPMDTLWHAVPSYPTVSEVWLRLLEARRD